MEVIRCPSCFSRLGCLKVLNNCKGDLLNACLIVKVSDSQRNLQHLLGCPSSRIPLLPLVGSCRPTINPFLVHLLVKLGIKECLSHLVFIARNLTYCLRVFVACKQPLFLGRLTLISGCVVGKFIQGHPEVLQGLGLHLVLLLPCNEVCLGRLGCLLTDFLLHIQVEVLLNLSYILIKNRWQQLIGLSHQLVVVPVRVLPTLSIYVVVAVLGSLLIGEVFLSKWRTI